MAVIPPGRYMYQPSRSEANRAYFDIRVTNITFRRFITPSGSLRNQFHLVKVASVAPVIITRTPTILVNVTG